MNPLLSSSGRLRFSLGITLLGVSSLLPAPAETLSREAYSLHDRHVLFDNASSRTAAFFTSTQVVAPSRLDNHEGHLPVATDHLKSPPNSLRLSWTSARGGDWQASLSIPKRFARPFVFEGDTLSLWVWCDTGLDELSAPRLFFRDTEGHGTPAVVLTSGGAIPAGKWVNLRFPLRPPAEGKQDTASNDYDRRLTESISLMQGLDDGKPHTLYIDDVRILPAALPAAPAPESPKSLEAATGERHVTLRWPAAKPDSVLEWRIYKFDTEGNPHAIGTQDGRYAAYVDWLGEPGRRATYAVSALDLAGQESPLSPQVTATTKPLDDERLLDQVQEGCFRYYWEEGHPEAGLAPEVMPGDRNLIATGGNGFGIMALLVAAERGFVPRQQALERMLKIVRFYARAERYHGAWAHFIDGRTAKTIAYFGTYDDGADLVETAFLIQGLLAARQYWNGDTPEEREIRTTITRLWEEVEWDWFRKTPDSDVLYWHWSPRHGFHINHPLIGWNETFIVYLLAAASPTHAIPASMYHKGWAGTSPLHVDYRRTWSRTTEGDHYVNGNTYHGIRLDVGEGNGSDLFFTHFSFMGFDPRGIRDAYTNYFENNRAIARINHAYCVENPRHYKGYGDDCWGLSAGVFSGGGRPLPRDDNGTINVMASLASTPYTPRESLAALRHFYRDLGDRIWGIYGFHDGFNESNDWFDADYMALNQAPITVMIENHRTGLVWKKFMANPEIAPALRKLGFVPDTK